MAERKAPLDTRILRSRWVGIMGTILGGTLIAGLTAVVMRYVG